MWCSPPCDRWPCSARPPPATRRVLARSWRFILVVLLHAWAFFSSSVASPLTFLVNSNVLCPLSEDGVVAAPEGANRISAINLAHFSPCHPLSTVFYSRCLLCCCVTHFSANSGSRTCTMHMRTFTLHSTYAYGIGSGACFAVVCSGLRPLCSSAANVAFGWTLTRLLKSPTPIVVSTGHLLVALGSFPKPDPVLPQARPTNVLCDMRNLHPIIAMRGTGRGGRWIGWILLFPMLEFWRLSAMCCSAHLLGSAACLPNTNTLARFFGSRRANIASDIPQ